MTDKELTQTADRLKAALWSQPENQWLSIIAEETSKLPDSDREIVETLVLFGIQVGKEMTEAQIDHTKQYQRWAVFGCGVSFLLINIVLAVFIPTPTASQSGIFRTVLALSAAGFAAFIPGFLEVEVKPYIRAGGAIAVFVIVYFFYPAYISSEPSGESPVQQGVPTPLNH